MMAQHLRQTRLVWDSCTALTARSQSGKPYLQINHTAEVLSRRGRAWWLVHTQHRQHSFWTIKNLIQDFISLFGPSKSMPSDMSQGQQLQSVVTEEPQRKPAIDAYSCITRNLRVAGPFWTPTVFLCCPVQPVSGPTPQAPQSSFSPWWKCCGVAKSQPRAPASWEKSKRILPRILEKERHVTQHSTCLQFPQLAVATSALSTCQVTYLL